MEFQVDAWPKATPIFRKYSTVIDGNNTGKKYKNNIL
jgi:hypothetical protein